MGRAALKAAPRQTVGTPSAPVLNICSFDSTRSRAPFATATGQLGYDQIRSDLTNAAIFGSSGTVHRTANIKAGVPSLTSASLAGCNVFFTSVFTGDLSSTEGAALKTAVAHGMKVIADSDSDSAEQTSVTSILAALGSTGTVGGGASCNSATAGTVRLTGIGNGELYGPFGDLRGNSWAITPSAVLTKLGKDVGCGSASVRSIHGAVLVSGDPDAFDLFTQSSQSFYNPTDEAAYLNFIGTSH